jgi:hypothetical protein
VVIFGLGGKESQFAYKTPHAPLNPRLTERIKNPRRNHSPGEGKK